LWITLYFKSCPAHSSFDSIRHLKLRNTMVVFPAFVSGTMQDKTHPVLVAVL
jgi:hypothetical protein